MFDYLFNRMREPSTWAGIATIATALGHTTGAGLITQIGAVIVGVFGGAVAAVLPDKK